MSLFGGGHPLPRRQSSSLPRSSSPGFPPSEPTSDFSIEEINPPPAALSRRDSNSSYPLPSSYPPSDNDQSVQTPFLFSDHEDLTPEDREQEQNYDDEEDEEGAAVKQNAWPRAWRHYTAPDRQIYTSLLALRGADLSAHLYNTHALKARARDQVSSTEASHSGGKSAGLPRDERRGEKPWVPEADWTAWPLEDAPAAEDGEERKKTDKASAGLEGSLSAVFLRLAKEQWMRRYEGQGEQDMTTHTAPLSRGESTELESVAARSRSRSRSRSRQLSVRSSEEEGDASIAPTSEQVPPSSPPSVGADSMTMIKGERVEQGLNQEGRKDDHDDVESETARPVFSADDERSEMLLRLSVRGVMTKLDTLLLALHQNREGLFVRDRDSGDESGREGSASRSRSRSRSKSGGGKRAATPAPKPASSSKRKRVDEFPRNQDTEMRDASEDASRDLSDSELPTPRKSKRRASSLPTSSPSSEPSRRTHNPVPRDWSQVLGLAALTTFSPSVIARATRRCEGLFAEKMAWKTFPEVGNVIEGISSAEGRDDLSAEEDTQDGRAWAGTDGGTAHLPCPFPLCDRHEKVFTRGFRWREHLGRKHKMTKAQIEHLESEARASASVLPMNALQTDAVNKGKNTATFRQQILDCNPMGWEPPDPLICEWCTNSGTIHLRISRLLDHIKRRHKFDPRTEPVPEEVLQPADAVERKGKGKESHLRLSEDELDEDDDNEDETYENKEEMLGGVHVDGFMQPILFKKGRGRDRSERSTKGDARRSKTEHKAAKRKRLLLDEEE